MLSNHLNVQPGLHLTSPAGRSLLVSDVFVPRNNMERSRHLPTSFRNTPRKIVVFSDGSLAPLAEVRRRFQIQM